MLSCRVVIFHLCVILQELRDAWALANKFACVLEKVPKGNRPGDFLFDRGNHLWILLDLS